MMLPISSDSPQRQVRNPLIDGEKCGKPVLWFDYALGERNHMAGFVCDKHRVSDRVEKLALKAEAKAGAAG